MEHDADATPMQLVEGVTNRNMQRRSSMAVAAPEASTAAAPFTTPPVLVAGDMSARPHYLKERSATMRSRLSVTSPSGPSAYGSQSKASTFLLGLVERSHSCPSHCEPKMTPKSPTSATELAPHSVTQRRSGAIIEPVESMLPDPALGRRKSLVRVEPPAGLLGMMQRQNSSSLLQRVPSLQRIRSGLGLLEAHSEDEREYVIETELRERPLKDLVRDLELYGKKRATLLRILNEILRRLQDAEMDVGYGPAHLPMCKEIVDANVLKVAAQAMREFRFDVSLQMAAISVFSFLADVSDLYAFMMAELDVEPLVHKVVADHVSEEQLVMHGFTLFHAINESKRKTHVIEEHKARQTEKEQSRKASFVHVFAMGPNSSKRKISHKNMIEERGLNDLHRPGSHWQRNALSAKLGAPPVLTSHYDLEATSTGRRFVVIPPLERTPLIDREEGNDSFRLDGFQELRPMTSPEPQSSTLSSRLRPLMSPSTTHVAAIYSESPVFVAPSPLAERMSVRRTQSATALKRQSTKRRGQTSVSRARQLPPQVFTPEDEPKEADDALEDLGLEETIRMTADDEEVNHDRGLPSLDNNGGDGQDTREEYREDVDEDEDPTYDDDFADPEEDTSESQPDVSEGRLLPVGSDSELIELVENPDAPRQSQQQDESPREDVVAVVSRLAGVSSDSELFAMIESVGESPSTNLKLEEDPVTAELVGILNTCVTTTPSSALDSVSRFTPDPPKSSRKKKSTPCSPLASSWTPPTTIVRPVSRRIMDKTAKTTKRIATAPMIPSGSRPRFLSGITTSHITTILDRINTLDEDPSEPAAPTNPREEHPSPTKTFVHVPSPCSTPTTSISRIQSVYARGLQHHKADELDAAIKCYEEGIKLQHNSGVQREFASLYINLGSAKMSQHKMSDALAAFLHAERIQPNNTKAIFNCGLVLMQLERWADAKAKLEAVATLDSSHVRAKCALEQCEQAMRRLQ